MKNILYYKRHTLATNVETRRHLASRRARKVAEILTAKIERAGSVVRF
jgi:hypothetical protein